MDGIDTYQIFEVGRSPRTEYAFNQTSGTHGTWREKLRSDGGGGNEESRGYQEGARVNLKTRVHLNATMILADQLLLRCLSSEDVGGQCQASFVPQADVLCSQL